LFDGAEFPVGDGGGPDKHEHGDDHESDVVEVEPGDPVGDGVVEFELAVQDADELDGADQQRDGHGQAGDGEVVVDLADGVGEGPAVGDVHEGPVQGVEQAHPCGEQQRQHHDGVPGQARGRP